jgi:TatD DNase family protein
MVRSARGREMLAVMPPDRVLTETDGPFARGPAGPLVPGDVADAVAACGAAWQVSPDEAADHLASNLRRLGTLALSD